ncbi:MAG: hypothetical protein LUC49_06895 [Prevotella sp.]|nr:hypothetical protein [Prevotella sp.]
MNDVVGVALFKGNSLYSKMFLITVLVMIDTVNLRLTKYDVQGVNFMEQTPVYLDNVTLITPADGEGEATITGTLGNLKVSCNSYQVKVRDGSLCKWYLGDNYQTMVRGDIQQAIECLSDTLHLPMDKASVYRLDVAKNIMVQHPVDVYFNHLGQMKYAKRLVEPNSLYYSMANQRLCFYDKNQEQRAKKEKIPELYQGRNVLRIEQRYTRRVGKQFGVAAVTGAMLYSEPFYIKAVKRWWQSYTDVSKINDIKLNFEAMKTTKQLKVMGVLALVRMAGGELAMYSQINEARKQGTLTSKQACDLRAAVKSACELGNGFTVKSEAITELDKKMLEAIRYYR